MGDNNQLAVKPDGALALERKAELRATLKEMVVGGRKLTDEQIDGRMAFALQQGLDPISEVHTIVDNNGKTLAHTMGVNGLRRKNQEELGDFTQTIDLEFVTIDKMEPTWAYAYVCRLRDSVSYRNWQKRILELGKVLKDVLGNMDYATLIEACGPAPVTEGIGIVYKGELNEWKDRNYNPMERAKKRAEVNARHHRFSTNAPVYEGEGSLPIEGEGLIEGSFTEEKDAPKIEGPKRSTDQIIGDLYGEPAPSIVEPKTESEPPVENTVVPTSGDNGSQETPNVPSLSQRPYDPETLKRGLMLKSEKMATNAATVETQQVAASLSEILGGDDQRHELVKWLTDTATGGMKELTPAYIRSLNSWLKPVYNKNAARFDVDEMALKEATAAHAYVLKAQGQSELF